MRNEYLALTPIIQILGKSKLHLDRYLISFSPHLYDNPMVKLIWLWIHTYYMQTKRSLPNKDFTGCHIIGNKQSHDLLCLQMITLIINLSYMAFLTVVIIKKKKIKPLNPTNFIVNGLNSQSHNLVQIKYSSLI